MKSDKKTWLIVLIAVGAVALWSITSYNSFVAGEEGVTTAWSQVENVYQRRMDLIPNLVNTVQGAANFEKSTLTEVIEARAAATSAQKGPVDLNNAENFTAYQQAQENLSGALSRLMVVVERYPELKANQNFLELQSQLEGSENRIAVERKKYNEVVKSFNTSVRRFPKSLIANLFGFEQKAYFKAAEGADKAPDVQFNF